MNTISHESIQKTVQDISNLYTTKTKSGERLLNLTPGFQRDSVWSERDRQKLIDSIVRNYPLPAIFLYRREENGEIIYDVIDGKQRLETVLMFMGLMRGKKFWAKVQLPGEDEKDWVNWNSLNKLLKQHLITGYKLSTIEVDGDPADIIDLFVRINSTGKALTAAEKRHAKYYNSYFLKEANRVAVRYESYFKKNKILSPGQINRMKHVELVCELMASLQQGDVINKKAALDSMMKVNVVTQIQAKKLASKTISALNRVKNMFPQLYQTRFNQLSDYYSLVFLIARFENEGLVLTLKKRNMFAFELLAAFSSGVDEVRLQQKKALGVPSHLEKCREYLLTVIQSTDEYSQRKRRENIIKGLLESIFIKKDSARLFSPEQRRILWNTTDERICQKCKKPVTWSDFTVDHIRPFSKGGRTKLDNAAIMHKRCNAKKGNR
ncbi:MAG: DUF262 domain-containing protein [Ignavibacteria bacterium]|jgi:hypothetical protein